MSHLAQRQNAAHQQGAHRGAARESAANKALVASDSRLFWGWREPAGRRERSGASADPFAGTRRARCPPLFCLITRG